MLETSSSSPFLANGFFSPSVVFVFGSNRAGIHGKGAARHAARWYGAIRGQGEGPMGAPSPACYAIPTKADPWTPLSLAEIQQHVGTFLGYARSHPGLSFQVTRIGCGLAGLDDTAVAPLFAQAPPNCLLPGVWTRLRDPGVARLIVAGSRGIVDRRLVFSAVDRLSARLLTLPGFEVVSGLAAGPDTLAVDWARQRGMEASVTGIKADWARFGKPAGMIRNQQMAWYATHLVAFWDGVSPGTKAMIEMATQDGLLVRVVRR